jgi:HEAT repeats
LLTVARSSGIPRCSGSENVAVRRAATAVLGDIATPDMVEPLAKVALNDSDERVGFLAVRGLAAATRAAKAPTTVTFRRQPDEILQFWRHVGALQRPRAVKGGATEELHVHARWQRPAAVSWHRRPGCARVAGRRQAADIQEAHTMNAPKPPKELDAIADVVLAYRPRRRQNQPKSGGACRNA